jgi:hypothetical protein
MLTLIKWNCKKVLTKNSHKQKKNKKKKHRNWERFYIIIKKMEEQNEKKGKKRVPKEKEKEEVWLRSYMASYNDQCKCSTLLVGSSNMRSLLQQWNQYFWTENV